MAKEAYYFSHDCNAQDDPKIMALTDDLKMEGYGAYWSLIEKLRQDENYKLPLSVISSFSKRWRINKDKLDAIITSYGLFSCDENLFWSESLIRRMSLRSEKGKKGAEARWGIANAMPKNANASPSNALKESKGNESKGNEKKVKERKEDKPPAATKILFRDSTFFDLEKFKTEFVETKYAIYNLEFYYEKVLNWSNSGSNKKIDWIATARNFMLGDAEKGKAVLQNQNITQNGNGTTKNGANQYDDLKEDLARKLSSSPS